MIWYVFGLIAGTFLYDVSGWLNTGALLAAVVFRLLRWPVHAVLLMLAVFVAGIQLEFTSVKPITESQAAEYQLTGRVVGLVQMKQGVQRFRFRPADHHLQDLRLSWHGDQLVGFDQQLALSVRLKPIRGLKNPNGFDYQKWATRQGYVASGYIKELSIIADSGFSTGILRQRFRGWLTSRFGQSTVTAGVIGALLIGDRSGLSSEQWQVVRDTGTAHLLVVSGLHIGMIAAATLFICRRFCRVFSLGHQQVWPLLVMLLVTAGYVLLAGMGLSTQRAWLMLLAASLPSLFLLPVTVWQRWWLALAVVLTLQPLAIYDAGLWLSFGAVAALLALLNHRADWAKWQLLLLSQWRVFLLLTPMVLYLGGQFVPIAPVLNLIAIPLLSLLLISLLPAILLDLLNWSPPLDLCAWLIELGWAGLEWLAGFDRLRPEVLPVDLAIVVSLMTVVTLASIPSGRLMILPIICVLTILAMRQPQPLAEGDFRATLFDVGQGLAVAIETAEGLVFYDTGVGYRSGGTALQYAAEGWLTTRAYSMVRLLILSHEDNDHAGGANWLGEKLTIDETVGSSGTGVRQNCVTGQSWLLGGVEVRVVHAADAASSNDRSCVVLVSGSDCHLLLTGDISRWQERAMAKIRLPFVSWLVVPHHGSNSSSTAGFIRQVQPDVALVSAGFMNRYGHPHPMAVKRYRDAGVQLFNTAQHGAITLTQTEDGECKTTPYNP